MGRLVRSRAARAAGFDGLWKVEIRVSSSAVEPSNGTTFSGRCTTQRLPRQLPHEGSVRGGGPEGIFTVRPELLVPFAGEWAA